MTQSAPSSLKPADILFDEWLVMSAQAGDARAFERLHARWQMRIARAAYRYTACPETARDLAQDCWVGIWKGPLGGWAKLIFGFTVVLGLTLLMVIYHIGSTRNPTEHTLWAILGLAVLIVMGFAKEWMFARMNMLTILREIKRLQLEVAMLREEQGK